MTPNPKSIDRTATVRETAEVLQNSGIHIAPVIDAAGRPIGVVSRTDLLDYWGRRRDRLAALAAGELDADSALASVGFPGDELTV
jgi:CBS domain-containing protein